MNESIDKLKSLLKELMDTWRDSTSARVDFGDYEFYSRNEGADEKYRWFMGFQWKDGTPIIEAMGSDWKGVSVTLDDTCTLELAEALIRDIDSARQCLNKLRPRV